MGDKRRFSVFADFIADELNRCTAVFLPKQELRIADVAAGKGQLTWALKERGFVHVTPFEPYPRKGGHVRRLGMHVREFTPELAKNFDVVVGMHPDGATDCILSGCALYKKLVFIVPCCTRPNAWSYWGPKQSQTAWRAHLVERSEKAGLFLSEGRLRMTGANVVLWGNTWAPDSEST